MHDFVSHILRRYFEATHWNEYNSYLHLTSSSSSLLDFPIPSGLSLSISASPTPPFFTSYRLGALPNLRAGIGYIYASTNNPIDFGRSSADVQLKSIIERFRIVEATRRPERRRGKEYWLGGERFYDELKGEEGGAGEYLVYGCLHVPSARLDALWTKRLSPTTQLIVTAVSTPPKYPINALQSAALATQSSFSSTAKGAGLAESGTLSSSNPNISNTAPTPTYGSEPPGSTNLQLTLQRDTGRWFTEYSYSVDDALWGFRVLHNFGPSSSTSSTVDTSPPKPRIDTTPYADADAGGGLRGRFSAGAEVFISAVEKSAGLSTGIRFSTLPDPIITPSSESQAGPSQPPTVITATLNPMMGHLSTAYAARMARDVVVGSRFDFNVYSYESEWGIGGEWWLRGGAPTLSTTGIPQERVVRDLTAAAPAASLREPPNSTSTVQEANESWSLRPPAAPLAAPGPIPPPVSSPLQSMLSPITGVLKARISSTSDIRLLWQGRLSHCLLSLGVKADLSPSQTASTGANKMGIVKSIGLEVMYFSTADETA